MNNIKETYWNIIGGIYGIDLKKIKDTIEDMQHWPARFWHRTEGLRHLPKHLYWHLTKGFCYCETWCLNYIIANYAIKRLKYMRDNLYTTPMSMFPEPTYDEIANKAFELYQHRQLIGESGDAELDWKTAQVILSYSYNDVVSEQANKKWKETLDEIIWALEYSITSYTKYPNVIIGYEPIGEDEMDKLFYKNEDCKPVYDWNVVHNNNLRCQRGLELFGKHFRSLVN